MWRLLALLASLMLVLTACTTFTISGTVSGLGSGEQITLTNNNLDPTIVTANGGFTFVIPVIYNSSYQISVAAAPIGKTCTVTNGSGFGVVANVTNVTVVCRVNTFSISGTVSGLAAGEQVTLLNNYADPTTVPANGSFSFAARVVKNGSYLVTVGAQPAGKRCSVVNGSGSGVVANVNNVSVICGSLAFTISGMVSGLAAGEQVTLLNNGADATTIASDGGFTFSLPVVYNASYAVTVGTQPSGGTCTVANGSGSNVVANITNVGVSCSPTTFTVSGNVSGLGSGTQVTLLNNGADPTTVTVDGSFTFVVPVVYHAGYSVTVGTQPNGMTCVVGNGSGSDVAANITNVSVTCQYITEVYELASGYSSLYPPLVIDGVNVGNPAPGVILSEIAPTFHSSVPTTGDYRQPLAIVIVDVTSTNPAAIRTISPTFCRQGTTWIPKSYTWDILFPPIPYNGCVGTGLVYRFAGAISVDSDGLLSAAGNTFATRDDTCSGLRYTTNNAVMRSETMNMLTGAGGISYSANYSSGAGSNGTQSNVSLLGPTSWGPEVTSPPKLTGLFLTLQATYDGQFNIPSACTN